MDLSVIRTAKFNGEVVKLIKLDGVIIWQQGDIFVRKTDYSVIKGSTITIEYVATINETAISIDYDSAKISKNGNEYTILADGLHEIIFNINGSPHTTVRVATAIEEGSSSIISETCVFDSSFEPFDYMLAHNDLGGGTFTINNYSGGGVGLVNNPRDGALICIEFDLNDLTDSATMDVAFNLSCLEYDEYGDDSGDYAAFDLRNQPIPDPLNLKFGTLYQGNTYKTTQGHYTKEITEPGTYYLYIRYRDYPNTNDYEEGNLGQLCVRSITITRKVSDGGEFIYPATRIELPEASLSKKVYDSFTIVPMVYPDNYTEEIKVTYDENYVSYNGASYKALKSGVSNIVFSGTYTSTTVNLNISDINVQSIKVDESHAFNIFEENDRVFKINVEVKPAVHSDTIIVEYDENYLDYDYDSDTFYYKENNKTFVTTSVRYRSKNTGISAITELKFMSVSGNCVCYTLTDTDNYINDEVPNASYKKYGIPVAVDSAIYELSVNSVVVKKDGTMTEDVTNLKCSDVDYVISRFDDVYTKSVFMPYNVKSVIYISLPDYIKDCRSMFRGCEYLIEILRGSETLVNNNITNVLSMMGSCRQLKSVDFSKWETAHIDKTEFAGFFFCCSSLEKVCIDSWKLNSYYHSLFDSAGMVNEIHCSPETLNYILESIPDRTKPVLDWGTQTQIENPTTGVIMATGTVSDTIISQLKAKNWTVKYK